MNTTNEPYPPRRVHLVPRPEDAEIGDVVDGQFFDDARHALVARLTIVLSDRVEVWAFERTTAMCVLTGGNEYYVAPLWQRVQ